MELKRISEGRTDHTPSPEASGLLRVVPDAAEPTVVEARQHYLEALHIPAALVVRHGGALQTVARNHAFERIADGVWSEALADLSAAVDAFIDSRDDKSECDWQQPGVGGRFYRVHISRLPAIGMYHDRVLLSMVDRTAEMETARSLRAEMLRDGLTGLPNRIAFDEAIGGALEEDGGQECFAVLVIDLVRFSRINECIGSLAGDELILTVAGRIVSALRPADVLARLAGDEFGVLLRLADGPGDALHAARRIHTAMAAPIRLRDLEIHIDCAIGCALFGDRAPTSADLQRNAQVALKRAKASGKVEVYQPGEVNLVRRRFGLETDLRRAIQNDELEISFQPLIDLESNAVSGFEALTRWEHPNLGTIAPTEFISVAEDSGLIVPLGRWALDAAVRTLASWDAQSGMKLPIRLCVNMSPVQIARDSVFDAVVSTLTAHGVEGDRLTLELTESSIIADPERAKRVMRQLHDLGCRVAMDDFGTGYSSLAYLQRLPIDILKIDRSFVTDMHEDRDSVAIIRAILSLARTLGMETTAEGVETVEMARTLAALGCTTGQGYYFSRPLTADAALDYFRSRKA